MKLKSILLSALAILCLAGAVSAQNSLTVQDVTGTTNKRAGIRTLIFPNGTVSISGPVVTIAGIGASFTNGSSLTDTISGGFLLGGAPSATPTNQSLTAQAGVGTNIAGANLTLASGASTGTGRSFIKLQVPIPGLTGSSSNTVADRFDAGSLSLLGANNTATAFATVTLGTTGLWSAQVFWTLNVTDGTEVQSFSGMSTVALVCKGTTVTATITETAGNQSKAVSSGTLTEAITQTNASGVVTLKMTANSSLTATIERFDYVIVPMSNVSPALQ